MQYNTPGNATGNAVTDFKPTAMPVHTSATPDYTKQSIGHNQKDQLTFKDKAGLVFVVFILLALQLLEKARLLK